MLDEIAHKILDIDSEDTRDESTIESIDGITELVGYGGGRVVARVSSISDDYIVKFARREEPVTDRPRSVVTSGIYQNRVEEFLTENETKLDEYILPLNKYSEDSLWVVQPFGSDILQSVFIQTKLELEQKNLLFREFDSQVNWKEYNQQAVISDYGYIGEYDDNARNTDEKLQQRVRDEVNLFPTLTNKFEQ